MTYREALQALIAKNNEVYAELGRLRDYAVLDEKDYYNRSRAHLDEVCAELNRLDNKLPDNRAEMEL